MTGVGKTDLVSLLASKIRSADREDALLHCKTQRSICDVTAVLPAPSCSPEGLSSQFLDDASSIDVVHRRIIGRLINMKAMMEKQFAKENEALG